MKNFLLGFVVGAATALWYAQTRGQLDIDQRFVQMQDRANAVLNESRRILEETRRELTSAFEAGRQTVQQRTERLRRGEGPGEPGTGDVNPPTA